MRPWFQELCRNLTGSFALSMEREYPQGDKLRTLRENSIIYMRLFEELYLRPLSDEPSSPQHKDRKRAHATLAALEDSLYPISREAIPGGIKQLYDSYRGRGIVMTSGFFHFRSVSICFLVR